MLCCCCMMSFDGKKGLFHDPIASTLAKLAMQVCV